MRIKLLNLLVALAVVGCFLKPDRRGQGDDAPIIDAAPPDTSGVDLCAMNSAACAAKNGICTAGLCLIIQVGATAVTCPDNMPCRVNCTAVNACDDGVSCAKATTCEVNCTAAACKTGGVDCAQAGYCKVRCLGDQSCQNGDGADVSVECRTSNCDVTCDQPGACQQGVDVDSGGGCTAHCCNGACNGGTNECVRLDTCI